MVAHPLRNAGTPLLNVHQEQLVINKTEWHVQLKAMFKAASI
jgi:hypothetical protein